MRQIIDSHAHLDDPAFSKDREELVAAMPAQGLLFVINPGSDIRSSERAVELAKRIKRVYAAVGTHPHEASAYDGLTELAYMELAKCEKVVAIGEIGLDYYYENSPTLIQQEVFKRQIQLACELDLPIIVHSRDADEDCYRILKENLGPKKGVMHCYSGDYASALRYIELGMYISLAGTVTFKKAPNPQEVAQKIPLEHLLIETDAPYLTPVPFRGKRNEPAYVHHVAERIAQIKGIGIDKVINHTRENAIRLFNLPTSP